jgi:hypothetical protein
VDEIRWRGATEKFAAWATRMEDPKVLARASKAPVR